MRRIAMLAVVLMLGAACDDDETPTQPGGSNTGPIVFNATLNTANEVPAIPSSSEAACTGTATITMNVPRDTATGAVTGGGTIDFSYTIAACPANTVIRAAHIHAGPSRCIRRHRCGYRADRGHCNVTLTTGATTAPITATGRSVDQTLATQIANDPDELLLQRAFDSQSRRRRPRSVEEAIDSELGLLPAEARLGSARARGWGRKPKHKAGSS